MPGLVRADTELLRAVATEMQRMSSAIQEQVGHVENALLQLAERAWVGQHRSVIEERWFAISARVAPATDTLSHMALRLRHVAAEIDGAALQFNQAIATVADGSGQGYLDWLRYIQTPQDRIAGALAVTNPLFLLQSVMSTPLGQTLWRSAQDALGPSLKPMDQTIPEDAPPRIFMINGINSNAVSGTADKTALRFERRLEDLGYDADKVTAVPAVYNSIPGHEAANLGAGVFQVVGEQVMGPEGYYTYQTTEYIKAQLQEHPLLPGEEIVLMAHSGGGAIAPYVAQALSQQGLATTMAIMTIGSPVVNHDVASAYARRTIEIRDEHDLIGTPMLRSQESRSASAVASAAAGNIAPVIATDILSRDPKPNVTSVATHSGEQAPVDAHGSYMQTDEALEQLEALTPSIDNALRRPNETVAALTP